MCVCVCVCVCVRRKSKTEERYMLDDLLICQRVSTSILSLNRKIIFVREIIKLDGFLIQLEVFIGFCRCCYV